MKDFTYTALPARVTFGAGKLASVRDEVEAIGASRALVLCTAAQREQAEQVAELLGPSLAGIHDGAEMHVPIASARKARELASELNADCAVAIGGGSTIGLGKAIALESSIPILAIPTTYAGSEMTPVYGITEDGVKRTGKDVRVLPRAVIYDPDLTMSLPLEMSLVSGMNAIAHAAEGMYAKDGNPVMSLMAEEGIRALAQGMPLLVDAPQDKEARAQCLYGAWLCGTVLGHVGMALHHKLCHTLGGSFNLPHAETHTIVLPHALAYNSPAASEAMGRIASAIGAPDAAVGLHHMAVKLGLPTALRDLGVKEADLDRACEIALSNPYWNPRPIEAKPLRALLQRAWEGAEPQP
ncbi:maleylacetate reductase [Paracoccus sediminis]|uniref:Maleylacetate reductase n=1 Tax=Paracoccus sediminis TaxID=1214787 RepID=A0A238YGR6_9RHOB|nr:maleylacetate reductase [Paracoccus sediminis]TBN46657.1 maleylacetate reductase [Paracoccus sediminis]SNR70436.1 maleylacetate reductase [Paracoccus sediminis]